MKKIGLILFCILCCSAIYAQRMTVSSFENLVSDAMNIQSNIYPKDCKGALITIPIEVGNPNDYTFEVSSEIIQLSILGNTIFLVIPNKTKTITIKHQEFGVIKDYKFTKKIKANKVYQLVVHVQKVNKVYSDDGVLLREMDPVFQNSSDMESSIAKFKRWVQERVKYPKYAAENKITGVVPIDFLIDKDGSIRDCKVLGSPQ